MLEFIKKFLRLIGVLSKEENGLDMAQGMHSPPAPWTKLLQSNDGEMGQIEEKTELTDSDKSLLQQSGFRDMGVNKSASNDSLNLVHQHMQFFYDSTSAEDVCQALIERGFLAKLDDYRADGEIAVIVESEHPVAPATVSPDATPSPGASRAAEETRNR